VPAAVYLYHSPMTVYLDDQPVPLTGDRLADVIAAATARLQPAGRMVVEVQLNGQTLAGDSLTQHAAAPLAGDADLRLYSADPHQLARQVLEQVRGELLAQQPVIERAADLLRQDKAAEAFGLVTQTNEVWLATMQAVQQAAPMLGVDLVKLEVDGRPFTAAAGELLTSLRQFKQQLTDQDTAALADTLGYEWPRLIEQWDAVIGKVISNQ